MKSEIGKPDSPRGRKGLIGPSSGFDATFRRVITLPKLSGNGWPAYFAGPAWDQKDQHDWGRRA